MIRENWRRFFKSSNENEYVVHFIINELTYRVQYICHRSSPVGSCKPLGDCCPRSTSRRSRMDNDCTCPKVRLPDYSRRDSTVDRMTEWVIEKWCRSFK